jgi:hypothetical protein
MSLDEMSLDEMSLDEMSLDEMSLDKMSVDEMIVDEMANSPFFTGNTAEDFVFNFILLLLSWDQCIKTFYSCIYQYSFLI